MHEHRVPGQGSAGLDNAHGVVSFLDLLFGVKGTECPLENGISMVEVILLLPNATGEKNHAGVSGQYPSTSCRFPATVDDRFTTGFDSQGWALRNIPSLC